MNKINIKLQGFGGELNIGTITKSQSKKLKKLSNGDLNQIIRDEQIMSSIGLTTYSQINDLLTLYSITTQDCKISITDGDFSIFVGDYSDLQTDYCGDYNLENIIAVSKHPDQHDFATKVLDVPVVYSFSGECGTFFNCDLELNEPFNINLLQLVTNEVKINTDDDTVFAYDFVTEVRYDGIILRTKLSDTEPSGITSDLVEP